MRASSFSSLLVFIAYSLGIVLKINSSLNEVSGGMTLTSTEREDRENS